MGKRNKKFLELWVLLVLILIIWIISALMLAYNFSDWAIRGTFGDSFGAINSLFSGLALAGIIYTILLQSRELELQREELILTRTELKRTADLHELNLKNVKKENRIRNLPFFEYETFIANKVNYILVSNESSKPAFDIDIWLFSTFQEEIYSKESFIKEFVKPKSLHLFDPNLFADGEVWSIADRGIYPTLPNSNGIQIPIFNLNEIQSLDLFIQYRDILGHSYSQQISYISTGKKEKPFAFIEFRPKIPEVLKRLDLNKCFDQTNIYPKYFRWIVQLYSASIPRGHLVTRLDTSAEAKWIRKKWN